MLDIGLIGFGRLGKIHADNITKSDHATIASICDHNNDKLNEAQSLYGCATFSNIDNFFGSKLDGVVIASSTPQHLEHIEYASKHGVPVFTEKPVGLTLEETDRVLKQVNDSNIPFQIGFQRRWDDRFIKAKEILESGEIGQPLLYKAFGRDPNASNPSNWGLDKNGGLFLNAAIHDYDAARFILGQEIVQVSAVGVTAYHKGLEDYNDFDTVITTMVTDRGVIVNTEWSRYATYGYDIGFEIVGSEGLIRMNQREGDAFFVLHRDNMAPSVVEVFAESYKNQIDAFIDALVNNRTPSPGIEDARIALNLALMARHSADAGGISTPVEPVQKLNTRK